MSANIAESSFRPSDMDRIRRTLAPLRSYFDPVFLGLEQINLGRPALWVGPHSRYGIFDTFLMVEHLYTQHRVMLRSLGDRSHYRVARWARFLESNGMVQGTPENCAALMQARAHILVYPGGGRELARRKHESYMVIWKQRAGFARLALEHGYDIIPFAAVGPDEIYKPLFDADDIMRSAAWKWLARHTNLEQVARGGDSLIPIGRGLGPTLVPRPHRFYVGFGPRIHTRKPRRLPPDEHATWTLRQTVVRAVESQIEYLLRYRREDYRRNWSPLRRWLAPLEH